MYGIGGLNVSTGFLWVYHLVMTNIAMENPPIFNR